MVNYSNILRNITPEQITEIMLYLGSENVKYDKYGNHIYQTICHGGNSYKLYYFPDSKQFHCYTECSENFNLFELVKKVKHCEFTESLHFVIDFFGIEARKTQKGIKNKFLKEDWDILDKYYSHMKKRPEIEINYFNKGIIDIYPKIYYNDWLKEEININSLDKFNVRLDISNNKIILPHYDIEGNLIGVRSRNLSEEEVSQGRKYTPIIVENKLYSHPLSTNLYGIYENQDTIRRLKKVLIVEGEKSVYKCESFFPNNNFSLAVCGSNISNTQRDLILSLGVNEVIIGFDKEFEEDNQEQKKIYLNKLISLSKKFTPYARTYIIWDKKNELGYKDSPVDKGKQTLLNLMKNKIEQVTFGNESI